MKSRLKFFDHATDSLSNCGEVLEINFSSDGLDWSGVILEQGSSPHFYPTDVYTPYFYFALALQQDLHWSVRTDVGLRALKTSPGDIWINPPNSAFSHTIDEPCYFVILAIEEETFLENCTTSIKKHQLRFLNNYNVQDQTIKGIIELFVVEAEAAGRNGYTYLRNLLSLLATHYIQNYSNYPDLQNAQSSLSKFDQIQVDKVSAYIDSHVSEPVMVDDLADLLGCSKYYFLREFKKLTGITPYQYLLQKRLEKSELMLAMPQNDIASVALNLGFTDQSHFTRAFKSHFGITPGQFQKQFAGKS
ncbi:MAG: AraC family transcriptional regulator [Pseudomonadota bacterium]